MLEDVVVDVNIFMHASNTSESRQGDCVELLLLLRDCDTVLCVDDGFDFNESRNKSHIGSEYLSKLRVGMLGYAIVAHLAQTMRIKMVARKIPSNRSKIIRQQVNVGPDRIYIQVAHNSTDRTLVSHDFGDMPQSVRNRLCSAIGVVIVAANEATVLLRDV